MIGRLIFAREYGAKVIVHFWEGYSEQRSFAISQAANDWILMVDADEVVTPELEQEVRGLMQEIPAANGYWIRRRALFLGGEVNHSGWAPDYQLRLFDCRYAEVEQAPVHEGIRVSGPTSKLLFCLEHRTVESLAAYLARMNRYTTLEAEQRFASGARPVGLLKITSSASGEFLKVYLSRLGFVDGWRGFLVSVYSSLYRLLIYAKLWIRESSGRDHLANS